MLYRFLHDNVKGYSQTESISVDDTMNSTYQTRQELKLTPHRTEGRNVTPLLPDRHQTNSNNSNEGSSTSDYAAKQDQGSFRHRTKVISSADAAKYKNMCCKSKNGSNASTGASPHHDQSSRTVTSTCTNPSNEDVKPPPLPPKSHRSRLLYKGKKTDSNSSVESVFKSAASTGSSNLLEERLSLQPSPPQQNRLV